MTLTHLVEVKVACCLIPQGLVVPDLDLIQVLVYQEDFLGINNIHVHVNPNFIIKMLEP